MLPSLALLMLAAWTVRALEVGAAPWERGWRGAPGGQSLPTAELESGDAGHCGGHPAPRRPRLRAPCASASLAQPCPGTRRPSERRRGSGRGAGLPISAPARRPPGPSLSADPASSLPPGRVSGMRETPSPWGEGGTCGKAKAQRLGIQCPARKSPPFAFPGVLGCNGGGSGAWDAPDSPSLPTPARLPCEAGGRGRRLPAQRPSPERARGRAPPSSGKLCAFPSLPFV